MFACNCQTIGRHYAVRTNSSVLVFMFEDWYHLVTLACVMLELADIMEILVKLWGE